MKNKYVTPVIAVEHYEITQSIAACSTKIGMYDGPCVIKDPDSTPQMKDFAYAGLFNDGYCELYASGMDGTDGICYHTNANAAFTS